MSSIVQLYFWVGSIAPCGVESILPADFLATRRRQIDPPVFPTGEHFDHSQSRVENLVTEPTLR